MLKAVTVSRQRKPSAVPCTKARSPLSRLTIPQVAATRNKRAAVQCNCGRLQLQEKRGKKKKERTEEKAAGRQNRNGNGTVSGPFNGRPRQHGIRSRSLLFSPVLSIDRPHPPPSSTRCHTIRRRRRRPAHPRVDLTPPPPRPLSVVVHTPPRPPPHHSISVFFLLSISLLLDLSGSLPRRFDRIPNPGFRWLSSTAAVGTGEEAAFRCGGSAVSRLLLPLLLLLSSIGGLQGLTPFLVCVFLCLLISGPVRTGALMMEVGCFWHEFFFFVLRA